MLFYCYPLHLHTHTYKVCTYLWSAMQICSVCALVVKDTWVCASKHNVMQFQQLSFTSQKQLKLHYHLISVESSFVANCMRYFKWANWLAIICAYNDRRNLMALCTILTKKYLCKFFNIWKEEILWWIGLYNFWVYVKLRATYLWMRGYHMPLKRNLKKTLQVIKKRVNTIIFFYRVAT